MQVKRPGAVGSHRSSPSKNTSHFRGGVVTHSARLSYPQILNPSREKRIPRRGAVVENKIGWAKFRHRHALGTAALSTVGSFGRSHHKQMESAIVTINVDIAAVWPIGRLGRAEPQNHSEGVSRPSVRPPPHWRRRCRPWRVETAVDAAPPNGGGGGDDCGGDGHWK